MAWGPNFGLCHLGTVLILAKCVSKFNPTLGLTPHLVHLITAAFNEAVGGITEEYLGIIYYSTCHQKQSH